MNRQDAVGKRAVRWLIAFVVMLIIFFWVNQPPKLNSGKDPFPTIYFKEIQ